MQIIEKQLRRVNFVKNFYTLYQLEEDTPLILNTLCVYAIKNGCYRQKVDFEIRIIDNKKYIVPRYNAKFCDCFLLNGERLVMCKIDVIKNSKGDFTSTV